MPPDINSSLIAIDPSTLRAHQMFFAGAALMLATLHLGLFAFQRQRRENLLCALFALALGIVIFVNFEAGLDTATFSLPLAQLFLSSTAIATLAWLATLHTLLEIRRSRRLTTLAALSLGVAAWSLVAPGNPAYVALIGLLILASVVAGWWIFEGWKTHAPSAGILSTGMALFAGAILVSLLATLGIGPSFNGIVYLPAYGGLCALISLSLIVARNFIAVSDRLAAKLVEVEDLSRRNLAAEKEKQRLITDRNRDLEALVSARTAELQEAKQKSDDLLYNILPADAADELKATGHARTRRFEDVTVIFSDFRGFTNTVATMPADRLIAELNDIFNQFDDIIDRHGLQKIKTIGDAYMAVGGMPETAEDAPIRAVDAALDMAACIDARNRDSAVKWQMRVGVHTGAVVAGVIGKRRLIYDIFGDTVNIASRMESHGEPGRINLSAYTYERVRARHACDYRGKIELKGKGEIDMYLVSPQPMAPAKT